MDDKLNRIKVVMAEKDKTGLWLSKQIGKSNTTVSKYINQRVQRIAIEQSIIYRKFDFFPDFAN